MSKLKCQINFKAQNPKIFGIGILDLIWHLALGFWICAIFFGSALYASAQTGPISSGIVHCTGDPCTLCDFWILGDRLTRFLLFNVMLPIAALMILIAGVMLLTARDNQQQQTQGKQVLWYAVWGMIIAFAAWLIVSTLLTTLGYKGTWYEFPDASQCVGAATPSTNGSPPPSNGSPPPPSPAGTLSHDQAKDILQTQNGMQICATQGGCDNPCADQTNEHCTYLGGMPQSLADELIQTQKEMKEALGCADCVLRINGYSETGHDTHGEGKKIIDLDDTSQTNQFIQGKIGTNNPSIDTWYSGGSNEYYYYEGNHWHACFNTTDCPKAVGSD